MELLRRIGRLGRYGPSIICLIIGIGWSTQDYFWEGIPVAFVGAFGIYHIYTEWGSK